MRFHRKPASFRRSRAGACLSLCAMLAGSLTLFAQSNSKAPSPEEGPTGQVPPVFEIAAATSPCDTAISGTTDGMEKPNQSKVFYFDNTWWILAQKSGGNWSLWRFDGGVTWTDVYSFSVSSNDRPDAIVDFTQQRLYVFFSSSGNGEFWVFDYTSSSRTWSNVAQHNVPVVHTTSGDPASFARAKNGDFWAFTASAGKLSTVHSTDEGATWSSEIVIDGSISESFGLTDAVAFTDTGGVDYLAVGIGADTGTNARFHFYIHKDSDPEGMWVDESNNVGPIQSEQADDHICLAVDRFNNVYMMTKNHGSGPANSLYKRSPDSTWQAFGVLNDFAWTRPVVIADNSNDSLYILGSRIGDRVEYKRCKIGEESTLSNDGLITPVLEEAGQYMVNLSVPFHAVYDSTEFMVIADNSDAGNVWFARLPVGAASPCPWLPQPPPFAPTNLTATLNGLTNIDLTWKDNADNETGFKIERMLQGDSFVEIDSVGSNITFYQDTGLLAETLYTYRVRAYNDSGYSVYSNQASATTGTPTIPIAPTNLVATTISSNQIDLTWTDNSNDEDGFRIERKTGAGGVYAEIATTFANISNYSDTGLNKSTTYYYRVRAYNPAGNSAYTNEDSATTSAESQPPVVTILTPVAGKTYALNQPLCYAGTATDPEEGDLPAANFEWRADLPNGQTDYFIASGVKNGSATPTLAGTYVLKLTVTDSQGLSTTATVTFNGAASAPANTLPTALAEASSDTGFSPLQVQFTGSNSVDTDGAVRYAWDFGDGTTSDKADPLHTYAGAGTYIATLTVTDDNCDSDTDQITILVKDKLLLETKAFLEGPFDAALGEMTTTLRSNALLPLTSPYSEDPRTISNMPADVVDWVLVELRPNATGAPVVSRSALLRKDGRVVADDGLSTQIRLATDAGSYYIVISHRNHLSIMSAAAVALNTATSTLYDFSSAPSQAYGTDPMALLATGVYGLRAGDGNSDGGVDAFDRNTVWRQQNGAPWTYEKYGDFNLDGGIDAIDRNLFWRPNNGTATQVP